MYVVNSICKYILVLGQGWHRPSKSYETPKFVQQSEKVIDALIGSPKQLLAT